MQLCQCLTFHKCQWKSLIECSIFRVDDVSTATVVLLDKTWLKLGKQACLKALMWNILEQSLMLVTVPGLCP